MDEAIVCSSNTNFKEIWFSLTKSNNCLLALYSYTTRVFHFDWQQQCNQTAANSKFNPFQRSFKRENFCFQYAPLLETLKFSNYIDKKETKIRCQTGQLIEKYLPCHKDINTKRGIQMKGWSERQKPRNNRIEYEWFDWQHQKHILTSNSSLY